MGRSGGGVLRPSFLRMCRAGRSRMPVYVNGTVSGGFVE